MSLNGFLIAGALLFAIGAYGALSRRNAIGVLLGVELMLNAANLNFLAFWRYLSPTSMEPQVFVLIGITVAAAEAAVGLAIILNLYRDRGSIDVDQANELKG